MVIKGGARGGAAQLAAHLQRVDTNERAIVRELRGVAALDLDGALLEMEAVSLGSRSQRHFYHASINTRADEVLTSAQWAKAVDRLEKEMEFTDQPRAVVVHLKEGREHVHVVWSRIALDSMTAISDSHNYRRHELVSRELEREFGHARVQGAHIERDGEPRPDRTPSRADLQQADRHRLTPEQTTEKLTEIWNRTDGGKAFAAAIAVEGWTLARGDKRDFVVIDPAGGVHSLARRIEGAKVKDVRLRMADVQAADLPSVEEARTANGAALHEHQQAIPQEAEAAHGSPAVKQASVPKETGQPKQQHELTIATANAGMVAQQAEAQDRFEQNSSELEEQRRARLETLEKAITRQAQEERIALATKNRPRHRDGRER